MSKSAMLDDQGGRAVLSFVYAVEGEVRGYRVGHAEVREIRYHTPLGEGDRHFCDVYFESGGSERCFGLEEVGFGAED